MEAYFLLLTVFGAVVILTAWLPRLLDRLPLSLPMVCIGIGFVLVWTPFSPVTWVNPLENRYLTERLTEFVVIIALMGAGLKLDRPVSWRGWANIMASRRHRNAADDCRHNAPRLDRPGPGSRFRPLARCSSFPHRSRSGQ